MTNACTPHSHIKHTLVQGQTQGPVTLVACPGSLRACTMQNALICAGACDLFTCKLNDATVEEKLGSIFYFNTLAATWINIGLV